MITMHKVFMSVSVMLRYITTSDGDMVSNPKMSLGGQKIYLGTIDC